MGSVEADSKLHSGSERSSPHGVSMSRAASGGSRSSRLTRRQWIVMSIATIGMLANTATYGVLAPFYPAEARLKNNTNTQIGLVFSTYAVLGFVSSPIVGSLLSTGFSSKVVLVTGMLVAGVFFAVMGLLQTVPSGWPFFVANLAARVVQSLGASICSTCFYSIVAAELPEHKNLGIATLETMFGVGMMLGPAFGGVLYDVGGYPLPCYVFGAFGCVVALVATFYLPRTELHSPNHSSRRSSQSKLGQRENGVVGVRGDKALHTRGRQRSSSSSSSASSKEVGTRGIVNATATSIGWRAVDFSLGIDLLSTACALSVMNYNDISLATELERYHMSKARMGLVFLVCASVYAGASLVWGWCVRWAGDSRRLVIVGALITSIGTFLMRPADTYGVFNISLGVQIFAQALFGLGLSAMYVCSTLHGLQHAVRRLGFPDDISTHGFISGLFMSAMFGGCFVGPVVGGLIDDRYGYSRTLETAALFVLATATFVLAAIVFDTRRYRTSVASREANTVPQAYSSVVTGLEKHELSCRNYVPVSTSDAVNEVEPA